MSAREIIYDPVMCNSVHYEPLKSDEIPRWIIIQKIEIQESSSLEEFLDAFV